ncbi:unnamed protein product [Paramecium sonneborni]|uniref:Transmembrane protein n=1 Tax=Paramecium sonneborni TaxID=65129 RepID=A0A8S1NIG6_9CILI|nr:unnamed protein product [Paramecium sonneborni]
MKNETNLYFPEKIILWIYFGQLNGFLIKNEERNSTIFQEDQYLYAIFDYANIVNPLSQYINFEIMAYVIILQLIIFYVSNFTLMIIKQQIYLVSIYFMLFNWIMICPFQTIFVMATSKKSLNNSVIYDVSSNGQIFLLIISLLGTILIFITSTLSNFIFKKREINQKMLLKYDFKLAYTLSPLTQLYIIISYTKYNQQLYIVIHLLHFLIMSIQLIIAFQFPFGFTQTSLLFNQLTILSIYFNCLIFIQKHSNHSDQFIFLSLLIIGMLLWYSVHLLFYRRMDKIVNNFCSKRETFYLAEVLEYFIQTHSYTFQHLLQLNIHRMNCQDQLCPCFDCQLLVIDNVSISQLFQQQSKKKKFVIYKWLVYQYQTYLQKINLKQKKNDLIIFNYLSFQKNFLENHVLTCLTIYQCIQKVEKAKNQNSNVTKTLLYLIQQKCKQKLIIQTQQQKKITQQEFLIITDINIMYELADNIVQQLSKVLQKQIYLWIQYSKNEIKNFDQLLTAIFNIRLQKKNSKNLFEEYITFRNQSKETIYSLRVKLLFYLIVSQDFLLMTKIQSQLMQLEDSQRFDFNLNDFNNLSFLTGQALSIISNISHENQGKLEQQITNEFKSFFGYVNDEKKLTHIKQLMPSKIAEVHSGLVENFFFKGQSDRINNISIAFILNSKNLIEQIKLCLSYYFPVDLRDTSFYMIAHIQKTIKSEKNLHDENLIGHLLVGEDFNVFGMTQNIYEKLNYRYFSKNDTNTIVISPQEFYNEHNIFSLIPSFQGKLQNYYQSQPKRKLRDNEIILNKERGLLKLDFHKQEQENSAQKQFGKKFSFSQLTSKQVLTQMMSVSSELLNFQSNENVKYFPIEFTVTQRILHFSNLNNKIEQFLYYMIEILMVEDFQKVSDLKKSNNRFFQNKMKILPQKIETQRQSIDKLLQFEAINFVTSDPLISQYGDKEALAKEYNQEKQKQKQKSFSKGIIQLQNDAQSQRSSIMNLPNRVNKFFQFLQTNKYPSIFMGMIGLIIINFIIVIFTTSFTTILFYQKKEIQSNCIIYTFHDVDYFNGFSLILSGSRHTILNSNYLNVLEPLVFRQDNQIIKLTSKDCIVVSWHLLLSGQQDLVGKYENYSQMLLKYEQKQITYYYPDYQNSKILSQVLLDQATYYTTMYLQFYLTYRSILSLNAYLSGGNDNIFLVRNRYILYFNYLDAIEITKDSIQSCYDYNNDANEYFDSFCNSWFIAMYIVTIFIFIFHLVAAYKIKKVTQIFLKQFIQIDFEESQIVIKQFENMLQILNQDNILFKYQEFQVIKQMPSNIFQVLQKQEFKQNYQEEKEVNNSQKNRISAINTKKINFATPTLSFKKFIFLFIFLMILKISFLAVFQYYYDFLSSGIAPSAKREIQSQKMRLDFIMTINMWDTYLLKQFYDATQNLVNTSSIFSYSNQNVRNNQKLLKQLKIDKEILLEKINDFQTIDLTDFLYHNADEQNQNLLISEQNKQILLGQDVCQLTDCDMMNDLFKDRPYTEYLIEYYQVGLIQLFKNVLQVIVEHNYLITDESLTPEQKVQGIIQMYQSFNYFLYIFYGLDAIQFQISQFCKYFLDQTLYTLEYLTTSNIAYVTIFGILLFILTICIEYYIFFSFFKQFDLARETIKSIPIETLFQKNIPKKLNNIMIKYN